MREKLAGIAISLIMHVFILLLLAVASFNHNDKTRVRTIEVDFSIIKDLPGEKTTHTVGTSNTLKSKGIAETRNASAKAVKQIRFEKANPETVPTKDQQTTPRTVSVVSASDARGETVVHGTPAAYGGSSGSSRVLVSHSGLSEGAVAGSGQGSGAGFGGGLWVGSEDYKYIRDAIMKNIKYPDRARRSGIEGKVLLSFTVLENGIIEDVRVVSSSGHKILDESAKGAAVETRIDRKMSHRVAVRLPVTYKLQY